MVHLLQEYLHLAVVVSAAIPWNSLWSQPNSCALQIFALQDELSNLDMGGPRSKNPRTERRLPGEFNTLWSHCAAIVVCSVAPSLKLADTL